MTVGIFSIEKPGQSERFRPKRTTNPDIVHCVGETHRFKAYIGLYISFESPTEFG